jgi:hypothetical protein
VKTSIGILVFGSLIDNPGWEIENAIVGRKHNVRTPFAVEFARGSTTRSGAPTLVPVRQGGSPVLAQILLLDVAESEAKDRLWRREVGKVGSGGHYREHGNPGPNTLVIDTYPKFEGIDLVISARFAPTIVPLTSEHLADLAVRSARLEHTGRDGITYLMHAKQNGIVTPLSPAYEEEILRRTRTSCLESALKVVQAHP